MVKLLEDYPSLLREMDKTSGERPSMNYLMPSFTLSADEWIEFENVYQVHCPAIFINNAVRDVRAFSPFLLSKPDLSTLDNDAILLLLPSSERA